jgi:hypothetical protein
MDVENLYEPEITDHLSFIESSLKSELDENLIFEIEKKLDKIKKSVN